MPENPETPSVGTEVSTGAGPPAPLPTRGAPNPGPPPGTPPGGIMQPALASDLLTSGQTTPQPPLHQNPAIADTLAKMMTPQTMDAVNSILGPALARLQNNLQPTSYYQPRLSVPAVRHSS